MGATAAWIWASAPRLRSGHSRARGLRLLEPGPQSRWGRVVSVRWADMGRACLWAFAALTLLVVARLMAQGDKTPAGTEVGDCSRTGVSKTGFQANLGQQRPIGKLLFPLRPANKDKDQVAPTCWALRGS